MVRRIALFGLLVAVACGDSKKDSPPAKPVTAPVKAAAVHDAGVLARKPAVDAAPPMVIEPFDRGEHKSEKRALAAIGAVPAWTAVVDRGRYLARRAAHGIAWGWLADKEGAYHWLLDRTESDGSLAIRVAFPKGTVLGDARRVAVWGAWQVDDDKRWYWRATKVARLRDDKKAKPPGEPPGHAIVEVAAPPKRAVPVSRATRPGEITFEVVRGPVRLGDGYKVADRSQWKPEAILILPGEREAYGNQDLLAADERWTLERNTRYTLRVGAIKPKRGDELPIMRAITAPRRITAEAAAKNKPANKKRAADPDESHQ